MNTLNSTLAVIDALRQRFPALHVKHDSADDPRGTHWFDLALGTYAVTIEERPALGFMLSFGPALPGPFNYGPETPTPRERLPHDFGVLLTRVAQLLEQHHD